MYLQKGHYTVKLLRQRETISFKPRRCFQMSARLHSLYEPNSGKFESASAK